MFSFQKKVVLLICLLVAGCSSSNKEQYCPALSLIPDGELIVQYEEGTKKVFSKAVIRNENGFCDFKNGELNIWGGFDIIAAIPEKAKQKTYIPFEYFVSVLDENNNVLIKKNYVKVVQFKKNKNVKEERVKLNETLTLNNDSKLPKYNILISFQLTEEQLKENRKRNNPYQ